MALCVASPAPVSAADASSTLCSGYMACSQGTFTTHGYESHSGSSYWTMYPGDNCTNYVAYVESTEYAVPTPTFNLGDGGLWATAAAQNGVLVNHTPVIGSVAVWDGGDSGIPGEGHVAVVEAVGPDDSYIVVSQQHMADDVDGYDWTVINEDPTQNQWEQWPDSFIHFANGPTTTANVALATSANLVVRVVPLKFANDNFIFDNRLAKVVTPGVLTNFNAGGTSGNYQISFQKSSLESQYVLHVSVKGTNVRVLRQGGPYTNDEASLRIAGVGNPQIPSVVTVLVSRGSASPTTTRTPTVTTTLPDTTSTTLSPALEHQLSHSRNSR